MNTRIILASGSPRRREILEKLGFDFEVMTTNAEENVNTEGMSPEQAVMELASEKGKTVAKMLNPDDENIIVVIAADTVVARNDKILGKPENRAEAKKMLKSLSGKKHSVYTGLSIWQMRPGWTSKGCSTSVKTDVYFKQLSDEMIEAYLDTGEYADKAGAYGIQGKGAVLVDRIKGDYYNVVGFPVNNFYEMVAAEFGLDVFRHKLIGRRNKQGGLPDGFVYKRV